MRKFIRITESGSLVISILTLPFNRFGCILKVVGWMEGHGGCKLKFIKVSFACTLHSALHGWLARYSIKFGKKYTHIIHSSVSQEQCVMRHAFSIISGGCCFWYLFSQGIYRRHENGLFCATGHLTAPCRQSSCCKRRIEDDRLFFFVLANDTNSCPAYGFL